MAKKFLLGFRLTMQPKPYGLIYIKFSGLSYAFFALIYFFRKLAP